MGGAWVVLLRFQSWTSFVLFRLFALVVLVVVVVLAVLVVLCAVSSYKQIFSTIHIYTFGTVRMFF